MAQAVRRPDAMAALSVPVAMLSANAMSYLLLLAAARMLSKATYGELLSLLGVLLVASVPGLAMQTIAARRVAVGAPRGDLVAGTAAVAGAAAALLLLCVPALDVFLHLQTPWGILGVVLALPGITALGTMQGIAQGGRQFVQLTWLTMATVSGRSLAGLIGLLLWRSTGACLLAAAVGVTLAAVLCSRHREFRVIGRPSRAHLGEVMFEALHAAHGHGAFLLFTSIDVLLARHVLSADAAGVYAAGSVVSRAALWLPQSVATLVFASLTDPRRHRRAYARAVALVAGVGVITVLGTAVLGRLAVSVVAGSGYHSLDESMWVFAAVGASLAVLQLSLIAGLALRRRGRITVIWALATADAVLVLTLQPDDAAGVARLLAGAAVLAAAVSVSLSLRGRDETLVTDAAEPQASPPPGHAPGV